MSDSLLCSCSLSCQAMCSPLWSTQRMAAKWTTSLKASQQLQITWIDMFLLCGDLNSIHSTV